jgi:hypothetical protein
MATTQPTEREWYRIGLTALAVVAVGLAGLHVATADAGAQTDLSMDTLEVAGVNDTITGNVTGATLTTTLQYETGVPNADERIIRLKAGPDADSLQLIDYTRREGVTGQSTGTIELSGDLLANTALSASDLDPATGTTETTEIVVQAEIEVTRPDGPPVTHTIRDTATVTVTDSGEVTATLGGTGDITIHTDG